MDSDFDALPLPAHGSGHVRPIGGCSARNKTILLATRLIPFTFLLFLATTASAQTISGNLSLLAGQPIRLEGFNGLRTYPISSARVRLYSQMGDVAAI
jgi:hypothetical protein